MGVQILDTAVKYLDIHSGKALFLLVKFLIYSTFTFIRK